MTPRSFASRPCRWFPVLMLMSMLWPRCAGATQPEVTFIGIDLTHMTYYPEMHITESKVRREMGKVIAGHGGVIDFATVQDVASRITAIYRGAGFVFTRAYVPQQRTRNGWVEVRLLEGWLSSIDILDNHLYSAELLQRPFADLLGKVVYSPDMEEALALLNDYPGLNTFGFYSVGEAPGSTRLNLRVQRERAWSGSLRIDNYGSQLTGRGRALAEFESFNPSGAADRLRVAALQTVDPDNATYGVVDYTRPVLDKRSHLALRVSTDTFTVSRAAAPGQQIEFSGQAYSASSEFTRYLRRSNAGNRSWHAGITRNVSAIDVKDTAGTTFDQKTWEAYVGFRFDRLDRHHNNSYGAGIDLVEGRYDAVDVEGQAAVYHYAHGYAAYNQAIALGGTSQQWKFNLDWQYSGDVLPAVSQYALTGATQMRGFLPDDFSADSGAVATATWVFPAWTPFARKSGLRPELTTSLFAEYGYGIQNVPSAGVDNDYGYMSDVGAEWELTLGPDLSATLTVAKPLSHYIDYRTDHVSAARAWIEMLWRFH